METKLTTDIFGSSVSEGRWKAMDERVEKTGLSSLNPDIKCAYNAVCEYHRLLMEARFSYWKAVHAVRGLDHPDYDGLFEGWERCE